MGPLPSGKGQSANPDCAKQCFLHGEALVAKMLPKELLRYWVDIVNLIKARPLKARLFFKETGAEHHRLLLHTAPLAFKGLWAGCAS